MAPTSFLLSYNMEERKRKLTSLSDRKSGRHVKWKFYEKMSVSTGQTMLIVTMYIPSLLMPSPVLGSHFPVPLCLLTCTNPPNTGSNHVPCMTIFLILSAFHTHSSWCPPSHSRNGRIDSKGAGSQVCAHLCFFLIVLCGNVLSS